MIKEKSLNRVLAIVSLIAMLTVLFAVVATCAEPLPAETTGSSSLLLTASPTITLAINVRMAGTASHSASAANASAPSSDEPIRITAVGDIMMHQTQLDTHFNKALDAYVFDDDYLHIKEELQRADLLIGNLETTLGGPGKKYSGYPLFNTPDTLAEALKKVGFDILSNANNHCLDTGVAGLKRTAKVLTDMGFGLIGTRQNPEDKSSVLTEVKGIKIGVLGYTYETGRRGQSRTLNGGTIPASALPLLDSFSPAHLDEAVAEMRLRIDELRRDGAELIIMYLHWGVEYAEKPTAGQIKMARQLASAGVDIIFGSHPHVVHSATFIPRADGGRTFVAWSLGNFISNQRYEFLKRHNTEDGLVVSVIVKKEQSGKIAIEAVEYQPVWVHRHARGSQWHYHIAPLPQALLASAPYNFDRSNYARARNSFIRFNKVLEDAPGWQVAPVPELTAK